VPDTPETSGVPGDVAGLRAENARLREANERLRLVNEDKDGVIADLRARNEELEERVARLDRSSPSDQRGGAFTWRFRVVRGGCLTT
jgi:hypothetical protein